jgi:dienelactone hydrolase
MKLKIVSLISALASLAGSDAALVEKAVMYEKDGVTMEGFHVYDEALIGQRPAVLVVHQWMGLSENEKRRSRMLAEMGCNVLAVDVYGKGVRPESPAEAGKQAGVFKGDRKLFRARLMAGLEVLMKDERTDAAKVAAIGYCFGGTGVLEMARAGAPLAGVVSFHGGLDAAEGMEAKAGNVSSKVLVLHGAADPYVPAAQVEAFQKEMTAAKADWQMASYGGAVHAFTQKEAGDDASKGAAYQAAADARSWEAMKAFFGEIFGE